MMLLNLPQPIIYRITRRSYIRKRKQRCLTYLNAEAMKLFLNYRLALTASFLVLSLIAHSQINTTPTRRNNISIMFSSKDDMDCAETELLKDIKDVKVLYASAESGLMIVESEELVASTFKDKLFDCVFAKREEIQFYVVEEY